MIFYQGGRIDNGKYVSGPVFQSSVESEYNAACTVGMVLAHFRMLIHVLLNWYTDKVPVEATLTILNRKSAVCMVKNGKDTNTKCTLLEEYIFLK